MQPEQSPESILKRIEQQSQDQKRQQAVNILVREPKPKPVRNWLAFQWVRGKYEEFKELKATAIKTIKKKEYKHMAYVSGFIMFASWMSWRIENKYDAVKGSAYRIKTQQQELIEKENDYIERMLRRKEFEPVPIPDEIPNDTLYTFQQIDPFEEDNEKDRLQFEQERARNDSFEEQD